MKYEKPEIVSFGSATEHVQFLTKSHNTPDCANDPTAAAYESDE
jgi:hypothetical protein